MATYQTTSTIPTETLPENLVHALHQSKDVQTLLRGYGDVLVSDEELKSAEIHNDNLPVGTVLCLPGSVVHAGPKSSTFRAVLFFSAWPKDSQSVAEYDPDTQYGSVFLSGRIVQLLWRQVGMDERARRYLLKKLYRYIRQGGATPKCERIRRNWASHFTFDALTAFIDRMEQDNTTVAQDTRFIENTAKNEKLTFFNVLGSHDGSLQGDFVLASAPHLRCVWENDGERETFEVRIYVRPADGKVLLYYPNDNSTTGMSWEGVEPNKHYRLERKGDDDGSIAEKNWFTGVNGDLFDDEGDAIICYVEEQQQQQTEPPTQQTSHAPEMKQQPPPLSSNAEEVHKISSEQGDVRHRNHSHEVDNLAAKRIKLENDYS
eukprot:CAMPEP_0172473804 /NCGR_PEP_ID=MMETSP1065-20121228/69039_1 /TAXON_ID=265537 /ORGANISM="Amphiprora paludosa, Strain CCMP125" /LENGTH=374 /DNA_ID=CAMNT_0013231981 /DNA_START=88 /DNA_END=1212 /DNA_ORIENTATION=-